MKNLLHIALRSTYTKAHAIAKERIELLNRLMQKAVTVLFLLLCFNSYAFEFVISTDKQLLESIFTKKLHADFMMVYSTFDYKDVSVTQEFSSGVSNRIYKDDVRNTMQILNTKPNKSRKANKQNGN